MKFKIPEHVVNLTPYKAGKPVDELKREKGLKHVVKLASNENPLGCSTKAIEALRLGLLDINRYPDPSNFDLNQKLAEKFNRSPDEIVCGSGSDSLIQYILLALTQEGEEVLSSEATFIGWNVNVKKMKRTGVYIPLSNYAFDLDAISVAITQSTRLVYLANPNNPTGTIFNKSSFVRFMETVPESVVVILDEAYTLYAADNLDYPNGLDYKYENLLILRTLSKDYGLAGLRLGICFGNSELISAIRRVRLPFEPSNIAQIAGVAALDDIDFLVKTHCENKKSLKKFREKFSELGIIYTDSSANFLMLLFEDEQTAVEFNDECLNRGLILRYLKSFGIANGIRINSGSEEETDFAISIVQEVHSSMFCLK